MHRTLAPILALALALPAFAQDAPRSLPLGSPAPLREQSLRSVDGRDVSIATVAGKHGTLVIFTCNHCPWAKAWETRIAAIGNAALGRGIGVVAINPNDPEVFPEDDFDNMIVRAKGLGLKYPYAVDATSEVARAFGATRTPEAFLFDAAGKLVYHGAIDDNRDAGKVKDRFLERAVAAVAAGRKVTTTETKAIGCGIRYREVAKSGS